MSTQLRTPAGAALAYLSASQLGVAASKWNFPVPAAQSAQEELCHMHVLPLHWGFLFNLKQAGTALCYVTQPGLAPPTLPLETEVDR